MSTARDQILAAVRATGGEPARDTPTDAPLPSGVENPDLPAAFLEQARGLGAETTAVAAADLPAAIAAILVRHQAGRLLAPADLPADWLPGDVDLIRDNGTIEPAQAAAVDGVVTACTLAIAETGTVVLAAGGSCGRRLLSLLPDLHLCVIAADQVVDGVEEAFDRLGGMIGEPRPLTLISGPSATSDIELTRIVGVHGPRRLELILVADLVGAEARSPDRVI